MAALRSMKIAAIVGVLLVFVGVVTKTQAIEINTCEGHRFSIRCPSGHRIKIIDANYGRTSESVCLQSHPASIRTTSCVSASSLNVVKHKCDGKIACSFTASNGIFGDPCRHTYKYLRVQYECIEITSVPTEINTCEGHRFSIRCPSRHEIKIIDANYGRTSESVCPHPDIRTTSCVSATSLNVVKHKCEGKIACEFTASNGIFGDPCRYTYKYLRVQYECIPITSAPIEINTCEGRRFSIRCPSKHEIKIIDANYGRTSESVCPQSHPASIRTTSCVSATSLNVVKHKCEGKIACELTASNGIFGDPCRHTSKYLRVQYKCM